MGHQQPMFHFPKSTRARFLGEAASASPSAVPPSRNMGTTKLVQGSVDPKGGTQKGGGFRVHPNGT